MLGGESLSLMLVRQFISSIVGGNVYLAASEIAEVVALLSIELWLR
jgi:hypothetical protein